MKPEEIQVGKEVKYWRVITATGEKYEPIDTVVISEPYQIGNGYWLCDTEYVGAVSIKYLEPR